MSVILSASLLPQSASLLPQSVVFSATEQAMLDELQDAAELDGICDALFAGVGPGATLPPRRR